jgi:GT2 family glycosyltransferase
MSTDIGVVVIGRNEGERLRRCLASLHASGHTAVYVDSGSTDGSPDLARELEAEVLPLDMNVPFTAARARNAGFARLRELAPNVRLVQFVDGDCEVVPGWLDAARAFLDGRPDVVCVCGRLRERHPERSIYTLLCDLEWNRSIGETDSCGGIAMLRSGAFAASGGFRESMICGEEPELCLRLRTAGGRVWRIPAEMAWHDASMTRFAQWWRRATRGGYAAAEGLVLHAAHPKATYRLRLARIAFWGAGLPLAIVLLSGFDLRFGLLVLAYPLQVVRLVLRRGASARSDWFSALFTMLANFPEGAGALQYWVNRWRRRPARVIEYR